MKNKNLVIKFKGEFEVYDDQDGEMYFIDSEKERHDLGDYMRVQKDGEFRSFDGISSITWGAFYLVKLNQVDNTLKFFYGYSKG